ncbi:hypothetical protein KC320_g272 [Hortaea werneckii]|nr:hypothetical protein KC320_g272 [Hortaea werneckii]
MSASFSVLMSLTCLPITRPSSTSKCMLTPAGLSTGPSFGKRMDDGGLRKKKGCFGRWFFGAVFAAATRPAARATAGEQNAGLRFGRANAECLRAGIGKDILGGFKGQCEASLCRAVSGTRHHQIALAHHSCRLGSRSCRPSTCQAHQKRVRSRTAVVSWQGSPCNPCFFAVVVGATVRRVDEMSFWLEAVRVRPIPFRSVEADINLRMHHVLSREPFSCLRVSQEETFLTNSHALDPASADPQQLRDMCRRRRHAPCGSLPGLLDPWRDSKTHRRWSNLSCHALHVGDITGDASDLLEVSFEREINNRSGFPTPFASCEAFLETLSNIPVHLPGEIPLDRIADREVDELPWIELCSDLLPLDLLREGVYDCSLHSKDIVILSVLLHNVASRESRIESRSPLFPFYTFARDHLCLTVN